VARTFSTTARARRINWRRELPPVIVVAGLIADYVSPPALWTLALPFGCIVVLLAMRKWIAASLVFLLSSWVLIPTAARTALAIEDMRGERRLYRIDDDNENLRTLEMAVYDPCVPGDVGFRFLPIGPDHLINPRWPLRRAIVSFAEAHNARLIARFHRGCDTSVRTLPGAWSFPEAGSADAIP
jgi:hypothetical protein